MRESCEDRVSIEHKVLALLLAHHSWEDNWASDSQSKKASESALGIIGKPALSKWTQIYLLCWDYMSNKNTYSPNSEFLIKSLPSKVLRRQQTLLKTHASAIMPAAETRYSCSRKVTTTDFKSSKAFKGTKVEEATNVQLSGHPELFSNVYIPANYFIPQWFLIFYHDDHCIQETETIISLFHSHHNSTFSLSSRN